MFYRSIARLSHQLLYRNRSFVLPSMASGKLDTVYFKAILTPDLVKLENLFTSEGYSLRLVGGVVRDLLLGNDPKDIDLATECTPQGMIQIFERAGLRYIPTGLQHGTVTVNINHINYEITTLRIDHVTDGRHALVQFTSDWMKDAERRDLTINAMSLSFDGTLFDYFNGRKDLEERKVRFVGNARERITEDYLRILRYFRFYGRISEVPDSHDTAAIEAIRELSSGLSGISVERIWMEMKRILIGNFAPQIVQLIYSLEISKYIGLPANGNMDEFTSVWSKMYNNYTLDSASLLISLVKTSIEADKLGRDWKLSNAERKLGIFVTEERSNCYSGAPLKYYQDMLVDGTVIDHIVEVLLYCGRTDDAKVLQDWTIPVFPLTGKHLLAEGITTGPHIGRIIRAMKDKWKDSFYLLTLEELIEMALKYKL